MPRDKISWLNILQAFTMLWVVIGHSPLCDISLPMPKYVEVMYNISHAFCMPMFFAISGYLFYLTRWEWKFSDMLMDKFRRLLIPFVVFTTAAFFLKQMFSENIIRAVDFSIAGYLKCFIFPGNGPLSEMWFIAVLLSYFIISPLWKFALNTEISAISTFIILIFVHYIDVDSSFFCIKESVSYAIFFYSGILLAKKNCLENLSDTAATAISLASFAICTTGILIDAELILQFGAMGIVFMLCKVLSKITPNIFFSFRNYTYQIFLMGIFPQILVKIFFKNFDLPYFPLYILCIISGIYCPVFVSLIVEKSSVAFLRNCIGLK